LPWRLWTHFLIKSDRLNHLPSCLFQHGKCDFVFLINYVFSSAVTRANRLATCVSNVTTFVFSACNCLSTSCKAAVETAHIASLFKWLKSLICSPFIKAFVTLLNSSVFSIVITLLSENESTLHFKSLSLSVIMFITDDLYPYL